MNQPRLTAAVCSSTTALELRQRAIYGTEPDDDFSAQLRGMIIVELEGMHYGEALLFEHLREAKEFVATMRRCARAGIDWQTRIKQRCDEIKGMSLH